jgi:hypothetical protein
VKLLLTLDQRHPFFTATIGGASGAASWCIAHSGDISSIAGAIGAVATASIAILSLLRLIVGEFRRWKRNLLQRRRWKRHEPFDDNLDLDPHDRP